MRNAVLTLCLLLAVTCLQAFDYSGLYTYNKGLNKANGSLYIFQVKPDSAFFYLCAMSGNPDFMMTNIKGFIRTDSNEAVYMKDSCRLWFSFENNALSVREKPACHSEFSPEGQYKRSKQEVKRNNTWMTEYVEKAGTVIPDSTEVYEAPHHGARRLKPIARNTPVKVIDDVNGFYLVEQGKNKNDFMWIRKKNVLLNKK